MRWDLAVLIGGFLPFLPGFAREVRDALKGFRRGP